ncbi:kinesin-like protein Klp5 [Borealophlyctis nickersoniae]|nr:kinesin-like protein Klp5 [Borealophlyctis nickersoniae]
MASAEPELSTASITVAVRVRPMLPKECAEEGGAGGGGGLRRVVNAVDDRVIVFDPHDTTSNAPRTYTHRSRRTKDLRYAFDRVFNESATQQQVYIDTAKPLIEGVLEGYNATVFAYGATGCGKTHTITGTPTDPGIIFLTMRDLFSLITARSETHLITSTVSYLEVYNETIRDLLSPPSSSSTTTTLDLREDDTQVHVANLSEHAPKTVDDVMALLMRGNENRTRAPTEANAVSSRSHAVLQIRVKARERRTDVVEEWKMGTLSIIDLAGSERASVTKNKGERLLEGANINRSLLALGNCINALCSDKPNHIPYRDSKLTRLLKYSLGGNCKVVMIANISPSSIHYDETHNTLKYANRAKNIKTKIAQNKTDVELHLTQYPRLISKLQAENAELRERLKASDGGGNGSTVMANPADTAEQATGASSATAHSQSTQDLLKRIKRLLTKIETKDLERIDSLSQVDRNERKLSVLRTLHAALLDIGATNDAHALTVSMDSLHSANVGLRYNADRVGVSIARHERTVEKALEGKGLDKGARCEIAALVSASRAVRAVREAEMLRKAGKEMKDAIDGVAVGGAALVVALHAGLETLKHGGVGESVVEAGLKGVVGLLMEIAGGKGEETREVEVLEDSGTEDEDGWFEDENGADSDGEGEWGRGLDARPPPAGSAPFTTPTKRRKMSMIPVSSPPTAVKASKKLDSGDEDDDATPTARTVTKSAKRLGATGAESTAGADNNTIKRMRSGKSMRRSVSKASFEDESRPVTAGRLPTAFKPLSAPSSPPSPNPSSLPGWSTANSTPTKTPTRRFLKRAAGRDSEILSMSADGNDNYDEDDTRESHTGPIRCSPARRAKRREMRQSLIPIMSAVRGGGGGGVRKKAASPSRSTPYNDPDAWVMAGIANNTGASMSGIPKLDFGHLERDDDETMVQQTTPRRSARLSSAAASASKTGDGGWVSTRSSAKSRISRPVARTISGDSSGAEEKDGKENGALSDASGSSSVGATPRKSGARGRRPSAVPVPVSVGVLTRSAARKRAGEV